MSIYISNRPRCRSQTTIVSCVFVPDPLGREPREVVENEVVRCDRDQGHAGPHEGDCSGEAWRWS